MNEAESDMADGRRTISDEQAAAVFRRAAQLQAEAAARLEERSSSLLARSSSDDTGLTTEQVEAAAREAGIDPSYVRLALAELGSQAPGEIGGWEARIARFALREGAAAGLSTSRVIAAPAEDVLNAMRRILPNAPYRLSLLDSINDPTDGGILVFEVPRVVAASSLPLAYYASSVGVKRLAMTLHPVGSGEAPRTEVSVSLDLRHGVRVAWRVSGLFGVLVGGVGGGFAVAAAGPLGAAAGVIGLAALGLSGGGAMKGFGAIHRHALRKLREQLDMMLLRVSTDLRTQGFFPARPETGESGGTNDALKSLLDGSG